MGYQTITKRKVYKRQEIIINGKRYVREFTQEDDMPPTITSYGSLGELGKEINKFPDNPSYPRIPTKPHYPPQRQIPQLPHRPAPATPKPHVPKPLYNKRMGPYQKHSPKKSELYYKLEQAGKRYESMERMIHNSYLNNLEKVFATTGIKPELAPIYKIKSGYDINFNEFNRSKTVVGFYDPNNEIVVLRSTIDDMFETTAAVHETVHHNLSRLCGKKGLKQKDDVEEGCADFITKLVMGKDFRKRDIAEDDWEEKKRLFDYEKGCSMFEQIYQKMGSAGIFSAYIECKNYKDLIIFMEKNGLKNIKLMNK